VPLGSERPSALASPLARHVFCQLALLHCAPASLALGLRAALRCWRRTQKKSAVAIGTSISCSPQQKHLHRRPPLEAKSESKPLLMQP
jgi:hypothetical protein